MQLPPFPDLVCVTCRHIVFRLRLRVLLLTSMEATKAQLETFNWFTFVVCCLKIRLHHFYYENFRSINEPRKQKRAIVFPYSTACLVDLNALPHQPQAETSQGTPSHHSLTVCRRSHPLNSSLGIVQHFSVPRYHFYRWRCVIFHLLRCNFLAIDKIRIHIYGLSKLRSLYCE